MLTPVVVACVTALLGIGSFAFQKWAERRAEIRKDQKVAYTQYLKSYHDWTRTEEGSEEDRKAQEAYVRAYQDLFPLASDGFLRAATAFHNFVWAPPYPDFSEESACSDLNRLWTDLVLNMRKDANVTSGVKREEIERQMPWAGPVYQGSQNEDVWDAEQAIDTPKEIRHANGTE